MIDAKIIKIALNAKYNKLLSDYDFEIIIHKQGKLKIKFGSFLCSIQFWDL